MFLNITFTTSSFRSRTFIIRFRKHHQMHLLSKFSLQCNLHPLTSSSTSFLIPFFLPSLQCNKTVSLASKGLPNNRVVTILKASMEQFNPVLPLGAYVTHCYVLCMSNVRGCLMYLQILPYLPYLLQYLYISVFLNSFISYILIFLQIYIDDL